MRANPYSRWPSRCSRHSGWVRYRHERVKSKCFPLPVTILLAGTLWAGGALAGVNGIVKDSTGAVAAGRGGTNISHSDNLGLISDNPAGLAWLEENLRVEFGADILFPNVKYSDPDDSDTSRGTFILPYLMIAGRKPGTPLTFGLGAYLPGGYGTRFELEHSIYGEQTYRSDGLLLKVLPCVAWRVGDRLSLGGGVGMGYSQARLEMPYTFQTGSLAGLTGLVDAKTDAFAITWNVGLQFRVTEKLALGATFTSQTLTKQKGSLDLDITGSPLAALVTDPTASYDLEFQLRWPRSAGVGGSYEFDFGRASLDAVWYDWSNALDEFKLHLSDGDNAEFNALAGRRPTDTFPLDWKDSVSIRVGYEHFLGSDTIVSMGYTYNQNPVPNSTLTTVLPAITQHFLGAGIRHDFDLFELSVAYQYGFSEQQEVDESNIKGGDFDSSSIRVSGHFLSAAIALKF